jgi:hypothetical protein
VKAKKLKKHQFIVYSKENGRMMFKNLELDQKIFFEFRDE